MKHKVCVVTGSRAEYGLLRPLLLRLRADGEILLRLVVTGSHLSSAFGGTLQEIDDDGLEISERIAIPLEDDSKAGMAGATGDALNAFGGYFAANRPDLLVVLGDRYEIFAASAAAAILGIAIAHISGGDVTEGSLDDMFRHCITKMSVLHFPGCRRSAERIIQMGEDPARVFNVGELAVENCSSDALMGVAELRKRLHFDVEREPYSIVTFHPATAEQEPGVTQLWELISALEGFPEMHFVITKANADAGGRAINRVWEEQAKFHSNWLVVPSLGSRCYLSAMKYAEMIIGNSSSGIIEAPVMKKPVVNIGGRQRGRTMAENVICCEPAAKEITFAVKRALTPEFKAVATAAVSPYGDGQASLRIYNVIRDYLSGAFHNPQKQFYDWKVTS